MTTATTQGAVSLLNATATGIGCAVPIDAGLHAEWTWTDEPGLQWQGGDARTARAVFDHVRATRTAPQGARATTHTDLPPARGLKTSSAAAAALLAAALGDLGEERSPGALAVEAVAVQRRAGTTLTGAYDDTLAVLGHARLADNLRLHDLGPVRVAATHVAVWVPDSGLDKARLRGLDLAPVVPGARRAEAALRRGDAPAALRANHDAYAPLYAALHPPGTAQAVAVARDIGAAGITGTGPAVAALCDGRHALPAVAGGTWHWHRVEAPW